MARPYIFQDLAEKGRAEGFGSPQDSYRSRVWFQREARRVKEVNANRFFDESPERHRVRMNAQTTGSMYMFWYDAKHKDTLPYWDQFPLILPFSFEQDRFKGFNLHYISPYRRALVLNALYKISEKEDDEYRRLQVSYGMLGQAAALAWLQPCIKTYLRSHVKSQFFKVSPDEWDMVVGLPLARFVGASEAKVWRDSARRVR